MKILACTFSSECTREGDGSGCRTCEDYYPREGVLQGEEVYCYQCNFDIDRGRNGVVKCVNCYGKNEFMPNTAHRKYVREALAEGRPLHYIGLNARYGKMIQDAEGGKKGEASGN